MKYFHFNFCFNKNMLELVFNHSKTHTHIRFNSPVSRFNRIGRSPFNLLRHSIQSRASSRLRPISFMSLFTTSINVFFGLPLGFGPPLPRLCNPSPSHSHPSSPHVQTISACFVSPPLLSPLHPSFLLTPC